MKLPILLNRFSSVVEQQIDNSEIHMCVGIIRLEEYRASEAIDCFSVLAQVAILEWELC